MMNILLINGPNLNLLGTREPEIYGNKTLSDIEKDLTKVAQEKSINLECFQSNHEGEIVDKIQDSVNSIEGILINAGAFTHTSISLRDALLGASIPYVELHLSNIHARESFRHNSYLADRAIGVISGFGTNSYRFAFEGLLAHLRRSST